MLALILASKLTLSLFQKAAIPYTETSELKKTIEKKKYLQVISILKKFVRATFITKHILDLEVNLTINKWLALALAFKK